MQRVSFWRFFSFFLLRVFQSCILRQREGESLRKSSLRKDLFLLLAFWLFACSHTGIQPNKERTISAPTPDCEKNSSKEGGVISRPVYKTWVKYDRLDFKKGFDLVVKTLKSQGH
jgi:hypothetical protein